MKDNCEVKDMKEKRNNKYSIKTLFGISLIATMFVVSMTSVMFLNTPDDLSISERIKIVQDKFTASATDLDPGNGVTGIVNIYIYPHSASATYDAALLEANAYEHFDASFVDGEELEGETPHSTTFDIIMEYQYNDSAYDTGWNTDLVDCWFNMTYSGTNPASQIMEHSTAFFDVDGTTDAKINFYLLDNDGGAGTGFTITQLEQVDDIQFKPYYYG